jgi:hypothetical protein
MRIFMITFEEKMEAALQRSLRKAISCDRLIAYVTE